MESLKVESMDRSIAGTGREIQYLVEISIGVLERLYVSSEGLFCFRAYPQEDGNLRLDGLSLRYTIMSLIGLFRAREYGYNAKIDESRVLEGLVERYLPSAPYSEAGLMLWADSIRDRKYSETIWESIKAQEHYFFKSNEKEARYSSLRIAFLLTGLSYYYRRAKDREEVTRYCRRLCHILRSNFMEHSGLFREYSWIRRKNIIAAKAQNNVSSFAAQAYPIAALAAYSRLLEDPTSISIIKQCAETLCRFQGENGQWPWLYNVMTGTVVDSYPVYSVHQGGMGPFALLGLQETLKTKCYEEAIFKSLNWLWGANELRKPIVDAKDQIIWRAIQRRDSDALGPYGIGWSGQCNRYLAAWFSGLSLETVFNKRIGFEILRETRPYEYGWYLWAFSERSL